MTPASAPDNYALAAVRHLRDAEHLAQDRRWDNAAHLLGFAAECAIKSAIVKRKIRAPQVHLPDLITQAKRHFKGRQHTELRNQLLLPMYFSGWDVGHRYAPDHTVEEAAYKRWYEHALDTFKAVGLRKNR